MKKPLVLLLVGPTASGKSAVAVELARCCNAEIISADSMQVYRGLDILSAKPDRSQRGQVPHHCIDILDPSEHYSAARFREQALACIRDIRDRGKIPLVAGGTGLYVRALIQGLFEDTGPDVELRRELQQAAEEKGSTWLYAQLQEKDPAAAEKIHPHNLRRVIRALEAGSQNRESFSNLKTRTERLDQWYDVRIFGIRWERGVLYRRIEQRVDAMFAEGAVEEVRALLSSPLSKTCRQALGIKQIAAYVTGECSLEAAKEILKRDTRRFAKRQLTWFRREKDIVWIDAGPEFSAKTIAAQIQGCLS
ncbi:MAG: tRNA (adenosine(37)-N6)-dimethylallyltransferase MiaA [Candidatus Omnitrophica bacterium]|nr:tRNA (adenosine(37)-N6)-dimethylallyltransferase MiaA [Candidatus Omnitrophota bacterium]